MESACCSVWRGRGAGGAGAGRPVAAKPRLGLSKRTFRAVDVLGGRHADAAADPELVLRLRHARAHSAGGGTALLNVFQVDVTNFVNQFLVGYFAPVVAAWFVLRGVVDISEGRSPLYPILGAMFLLSIAGTQALLQGWNSGTKFAPGDVLAGLWTYTASRSSRCRRPGDYWRRFEFCVWQARDAAVLLRGWVSDGFRAWQLVVSMM